MLRPDLIPDHQTIYRWIERIFAQGVRRPGYPADRWTEQFCVDQFRALGLENVRLEPVTLPYWEPREWSLVVSTGRERWTVPCFPLPHSAATEGLEADLHPWHDDAPQAAAGKVALVDVPLLRVPPTFVAALLAQRGDDASDMAWRCYDPGNTFTGAVHVLPFSQHFMTVMEPAMSAGAAAFVGALADYPGDSCQYYVPYDALGRGIPGVWISGRDGHRLRDLCDGGAVRARLTSRAVREDVVSHNVVGELPGGDDEVVIIGSHHDGPWSSAVEDASGVALVLAQAAYWSHVPRGERPHRLVFLVNAGHMAAAAGAVAFIERHRTWLDRVVLEVHLEHAANEVVERDGGLVCSGRPEPRWWFTSRNPQLESSVRAALEAEVLERSLILPPDIFGPMPTTDGGPFHLAGVPLVNFLTAPFYLFDAMDTLDKIHQPSLVPVTRAAIRIIESTRGTTAAALRAGVRGSPPRP